MPPCPANILFGPEDSGGSLCSVGPTDLGPLMPSPQRKIFHIFLEAENSVIPHRPLRALAGGSRFLSELLRATGSLREAMVLSRHMTFRDFQCFWSDVPNESSCGESCQGLFGSA